MIREGDVHILSKLIWDIKPFHFTAVAILSLVMTEYETQWRLVRRQIFPLYVSKNIVYRKTIRPGKTRRRVFAKFYSRTTRSFRRHHYVPTASQSYLRCGEDRWFCSNPSGSQASTSYHWL